MKEWLTILHTLVLVLNPTDVGFSGFISIIDRSKIWKSKKNYAIALANYEKVAQKDKGMY